MYSKGQRSKQGSMMAELGVGCMIMAILAVFFLDLGAMMASYSINDRACRDAARAAAQGANNTEANNLARKIIQTYASNSFLTTSPQVVSLVYNDFNGQPTSTEVPYVQVTTRATINPMINLLGGTISSFPVTKTYCFPIVKLTVKTS
jgi:Flp pilus assembly protein TadG